MRYLIAGLLALTPSLAPLVSSKASSMTTGLEELMNFSAYSISSAGTWGTTG